jgi:hypothetical protein
MANDTNLKKSPKSCTLRHPAFGEMNFPSLNYAAGWLGSTYLKLHCNRDDIYISYNVLAFLMDNKVIFQSSDVNHPLTGLQVVPLQISKQLSNKEIKELNNKEIKELSNKEIKELSLRASVIKENELSCTRDLSVLNKKNDTTDIKAKYIPTEAEFDVLFPNII